jgi:S1-C subfamily serine protease
MIPIRFQRVAAVVAAAAVLGGCDVRMEGRQYTGPTSASQPVAQATPAPSGGAAAAAQATRSAQGARTGATAVAGTPTAGTSGTAGTQTPAAGAQTGQASTQVQPVALASGLNAVQVVEVARPSVVNITTGVIEQNQFRNPVPVQAGVGTGIIFDPRGYILTNSHVVRSGQDQPAQLIRVTLVDDRSFNATVIDDDPLNDLAIVKIDAPNLTAAKLGDSTKLQIGEPVVAIGHALALPGGPTVSTGVVSALGRQIDEPNGVTLPDLVQTDAAINPGNSGGPLLNARGEVIGINTAGSAQAQGISFAVAINQAKPAIESVIATGKVVRPLLGVRVLGAITPAIAQANNLPVQRGVAVQPDPSGPAARAGVRDGDIVVAIDGQEVRSAPDMLSLIRKHKPGEQIRLRVARPGGQVDITATLAEATS